LKNPKQDLKRLVIFIPTTKTTMLEAKKQIELAREKEIDPHTVKNN
jgi:hypothetical protein